LQAAKQKRGFIVRLNSFISKNDMAFSQRLSQLRKERGLTQLGLADLASVHLTQVQRYESDAAQPTLEVIKRLAIALAASTDWLLFEEDERSPDDELKLHFEAVKQFDEQDRKTALEVLDGLILKHQAKRMVERTQSHAAAKNTAKETDATKHT
jgi:transcriptional regulator with XRE-family HTH domain